MLGVSHATSGAAAGLALAHAAPGLVDVTSPRDAYAFAAVCAGYAMLPDLDHPQSAATRRFSWASVVASRVVRPASWAVFQITRTDHDRGTGTHRGLTHTVLFAAALGWGVNAAVAHGGVLALWVVVFVGTALAVKGIDHLIPGPPSLLAAAALAWLCAGIPPWEIGSPAGHVPWVGAAVTLGMLVHCCGDALTESGCPLWAPLKIKGRRWYPVRPPRLLRFRTGGPAEWVILCGLTAVAVWLAAVTIPGMGTFLGGVLNALSP
jgi:membrane-bound metal-dependent hydrolase YbcI (DUF457 family)